jgi:N-acetylmuramoyl-L-alanine amidase
LSFAPDTALPVEVRPSPNHDERRAGKAADMLLLHYTGMPDAQAALDWLCDPGSKVSCHYFVFEDGRILQLVAEARRAWHAGVAAWAGEQDINSRSIGIEIANPGHDGDYPDFPEVQMQAVETLCCDIVERRAITPARVLAHSDVAPRRKRDPGEKFDWKRLARVGAGLWVEPAPIEGEEGLGPGDTGPAVAGLQRDLARFGYALTVNGVFDEATRHVVTAFQRHFRQARVDGRADESTFETLRALLQLVLGENKD